VTQRGLFSSCSVPWLSDITAGISYDYISLKPCATTVAIQQSVFLAEFLIQAGAYELSACKGIKNRKHFSLQNIK
jgi:hypothetical protein